MHFPKHKTGILEIYPIVYSSIEEKSKFSVKHNIYFIHRYRPHILDKLINLVQGLIKIK